MLGKAPTETTSLTGMPPVIRPYKSLFLNRQLLLVLVGILFIGVVWYATGPASDSAAAPVLFSGGSTGEHMVGGDRDKHGCIGSAGYTWCAGLNRCVRPWLVNKVLC